jgi:hypothetical protein
MTKESYEQGRHTIRIASSLLGHITKTNEQIEKYTELIEYYTRTNKPIRVDSAKEKLGKYLSTLNDLENKFEELSFPESNIIVVNKKEMINNEL